MSNITIREIYTLLESYNAPKIKKALEHLQNDAALKEQAKKRYLNYIRAVLNNPDATINDFAAAAPKKAYVDKILNSIDKHFILPEYKLTAKSWSEDVSNFLISLLGAAVKNALNIDEYIATAVKQVSQEDLKQFYSYCTHLIKRATEFELSVYEEGWYGGILHRFTENNFKEIVFNKVKCTRLNANPVKREWVFSLSLNGYYGIELIACDPIDLTEIIWLTRLVPGIKWMKMEKCIPDCALLFERELSYQWKSATRIKTKNTVVKAAAKIQANAIETQYTQSMQVFNSMATYNYAGVIEYINNGGDPSIRNADGWSLLNVACAKGNEAIVILLVNAGAPVNESSNGFSPLMSAMEGKQDAIMEFLLARGADPLYKKRDGKNTMLVAAKNGYARGILKMHEKGVDVHAKAESLGRNTFGYACFYNQAAVVPLIITLGIGNDEILKVFHDMIFRDDKEEVLKAIIKTGLDVNATRNEHKYTALISAAMSGHLEYCRILLEHGADPNLKNHEDKTALDLALKKGYPAIVDLLDPLTNKEPVAETPAIEKNKVNTEEIENCLKGIHEITGPYLEEGTDYFSYADVTEFGIMRTPIYYFENGIRIQKKFDEEHSSLLGTLQSVINKSFPCHTSIKYNYKKGEQTTFTVLGVAGLIEKMKYAILYQSVERFQSLETIVQFKDKKIKINETRIINNLKTRDDGSYIADEVLNLKNAVNDNLDEFYFCYDNNTFDIRSNPPIKGCTTAYTPGYSIFKEAAFDPDNLAHIYAYLESYNDEKIKHALGVLQKNQAFQEKAASRYRRFIQSSLRNEKDVALENYLDAAPQKSVIDEIERSIQDSNIKMTYWDDAHCLFFVNLLGTAVYSAIDIDLYIEKALQTTSEKELKALYATHVELVKQKLQEELEIYAEGWYGKILGQLINHPMQEIVMHKTSFEMANYSTALRGWYFFLNMNGANTFSLLQTEDVAFTKLLWLTKDVPKVYYTEMDISIPECSLAFERTFNYRENDKPKKIVHKAVKEN